MKSLTHTYHLKPDFAPLQMVYKATNVGEKSGVGDYRFGFGGHELDNEVKGNGNHYSFGDFGYDPRLGRRWNLDPMAHEFPWISPYSTFNDNPILFIDPDGNNPFIPVLWGWAKRKVVMESAKAILRRVTEPAPAPPPGAIPRAGSSELVMPQDQSRLPLSIESKLEVDTDKVNEQSKVEAKPKGARTEPADLFEQLAMEEARTGAGEKYSGELNDPKYDEEKGTHDKMRHNHKHKDGTSTEVHYDVNRETGERSGFKIKDDTNKTSRGHRGQ